MLARLAKWVRISPPRRDIILTVRVPFGYQNERKLKMTLNIQGKVLV